MDILPKPNGISRRITFREKHQAVTWSQMNPITHPINAKNEGIHELQQQVAAIRNIFPGPPTEVCPIVLVPGFNGWGTALPGNSELLWRL
ncbi:hypothetical protein BKA67DRAFT_582566 [Truncatella angustata]|uniref:Uncharacterized protein n=1 Tax=Truncatella angustata TaxID=152316 RepID=A0A9P8RH07_9PEZI|nr:uncharacterized protein BKA67DRAFT_582566 [Truncatella angustata]KAH6645864.1 hypothetical protein BKA67DRAFT_582566 [Truncatella angustata]